MAAMFVTSCLVLLAPLLSRLIDASVVWPGLVVKTDTCGCHVTGQTNPCIINEVTVDHYRFNSSADFPTRVMHMKMVALPQSDARSIALQVAWQAPLGGALHSTKGILLQLMLNGHMQKLYIPVQTTPVRNLQGQVQWKIECELQPGTYSSDLKVSICPTPLPPVTVSAETFAEAYINVPALASIVNETALYWKPIVVFKGQERTFRIHFQVPEILMDQLKAFYISFQPKLGVKTRVLFPNGKFSFQSIKVPNPNTCYDIILQKECGTCQDPWLCQDGPAGGCRVPARLHALHRLWTGLKCTLDDHQNLTTATTATSPPSTVSPPAGPDHTPVPLQSSAGLTVTWVIGVVLLLVTVALIIVFVRRSRTGVYPVIDQNARIREQTAEKMQGVSLPRPAVAELLQKMILILYSDDHEAHKEAIKQLATFLQARCGCQVILDEWNMEEMSQDILNWYFGQLDKSDKVIFVHSEGAFHKHYTHTMQENILTDANPPPKGDPFHKLLPVVVKRVLDNPSSFVMMHFSYTDPKFLISDICSSLIFSIPEHFQEMVMHIHNESINGYKRKTSIPLINGDEYHCTLEGTNLQHAIKNAEKFTRNHPNWFKKRYKSSNCRDKIQQESGASNSSSSTPTSSVSGGLNLIAPDSEVNSVVNVVKPQASATDDVDSVHMSFSLDSGICTFQETKEEVLGGIVLNPYFADPYGSYYDEPNDCTGSADAYTGTPYVYTGTPAAYTGTPNVYTGTPDAYTGTPHANTGTPYANTGTPDIDTDIQHIYTDSSDCYSLGACIDTPGNSTNSPSASKEQQVSFENQWASHANTICGYATSDVYRNESGNHSNVVDNHAYSLHDHSHTQVDSGNTPGGHVPRNSDSGKEICVYGSVLGGYAHSIANCQNARGGNAEGLENSGFPPSDMKNEKVQPGHRDPQGVSDSLDSTDNECDQDGFVPPESVSSCSISDLDMAGDQYEA